MDIDRAGPGKSTLLFVLGMHRSGTSAVTHFIHRLGAAIADNLLEPMAGVNAQGFWEDGDVVAINERLLAVAGQRWYDSDPLALDESDPAVQALATEARARLEAGYADRRVAVVKDPRLCRLLPFWLERCRECGIEPGFVHVLRHPFAVAKSLHKRDGIPYEYSLLLWLTYTLESIRHAAGEPIMVVDFEQVLSNPHRLALLLQKHGQALADDPSAVQEAAHAAFNRELRTQDARLDAGVGCAALVHFAEQVYQELRAFDGTLLDTVRGGVLFDAYQHLCAALADDMVMLRRLTGEMVSLNAELYRIGELHSHALQVIAERDREIEERKPLAIKLARPLRRLIPRLSERE